MSASKPKVVYTDAEKAAYWRKKATSKRKAPARRRRTTTRRAPARRYGSRSARGGPISIVQGYGDYSSAGGDLGEKVGGWLGRRAGHGLQALATSLMGFGDYNVEENTLFQAGMSPPQVVNSINNGEVIVRHREYLGELEGSIAFTRHDYYLNPGLHETFPWLATFASSFEEYRLRGAVVEFVSTSADSVLSTSANVSLGSVEIATQYNSTETLFNSKAQMLNHEFGTSGKPSVNQLHPIECKMSRTVQAHLYVRDGPVPANSDAHLYDLGVVCIATEGQQSDGGSLGELWISYEVGLFKPRLAEISPSDLILTDHFLMSSWSGSAPYGTASTALAESTLGGAISVDGTTYTFPSTVEIGSCYLMSICWIGASAAAIDYPTRTTSGCTIKNIYEGGANTVAFSPAAGVSSAKAMMDWVIEVTDPNICSVSLVGSNVLPGGANQPCDFIVTQFNSNLAPGPIVTPPKGKQPLITSASNSDEEEYVKVRKSDLKKLVG